MRDFIYNVGCWLLFPLFIVTAPFGSTIADRALNRWAHFILRSKTRTQRHSGEMLH